MDEVLLKIADYIVKGHIDHEEAYETANLCLADSLGCAILALKFPECKKLLGPIVPGTIVPNGVRVPGTTFILDPVCASFNLGTMIRWLDYNDTWLAAEWGHPSDNLGGILAIAEYLNRHLKQKVTMRDVLTGMIKAYEIQGILALENSFNRIGFDHVILVKVATAAVAAGMLGLNVNQVADTISNAWIDTGPLRTYRHAPNTGSRKSWAAGDSTSRGIWLALMTKRGEMGYPQALTAKNWGFNDIMLKGKSLTFARELTSYVIENILFKVAFPAEFHAQTAVECAFTLFPQVKEKWEEITKIEIETHESALRIIDKKGKLNNPADRDHCLQYMVAIGLLYGNLTAEHYEEETAKDERIDRLRNKMILRENPQFSKDYLDPTKRSIATAMTVFFKEKQTEKVVVEFPIGHQRRRKEAIPLIYDKCRTNLQTRYPQEQIDAILKTLQKRELLETMSVSNFIDLF